MLRRYHTRESREGSDMSRNPKSTKVVSINTRGGYAPAGHDLLGTVAGFSKEQGLLVDYAGNSHGPLPALSVIPLSIAEAQALAVSGQPILLTFERGQSD